MLSLVLILFCTSCEELIIDTENPFEAQSNEQIPDLTKIDENNLETQKMLEDIQSLYMPNRVMVYGKNGNQNMKNIIPFVGFYLPKDDGSPRVYVCQNFACKLPTSDFEIVKQQLGIN